MTILGLDLSLTSTGWSAGSQTGIISSTYKEVERLHDICEQIKALVLSLDCPKIVLEGYSFASRSGQAHSIGELGGAVKLTLYRLGIHYAIVPPTCRAKFATGRGNASKNEVVSAVSAKTGIVWAGKGADDMCDAWILEEMGLVYSNNGRYDWGKLNTDALVKVDWSRFGGQRENATD